jgi:hypothetical protein
VIIRRVQRDERIEYPPTDLLDLAFQCRDDDDAT